MVRIDRLALHNAVMNRLRRDSSQGEGNQRDGVSPEVSWANDVRLHHSNKVRCLNERPGDSSSIGVLLMAARRSRNDPPSSGNVALSIDLGFRRRVGWRGHR